MAVIGVDAQELPWAGITGSNCPASYDQAKVWYFGQNAGIDFRGDSPVPVTVLNAFNVPQGSALISDSTGRVLFYTDGVTVWDGRGFIMPNGEGMGGNLGVSQPAVIVPNPSDKDIYYLFTVDLLPFFPGDTTKNGLSYSVVDISLNGGNGAVTAEKNVNLLPVVSSKVSAVRHANGNDFWVVAHPWNSNEYIVFLVNADGVQTPGVVSPTGISQSGDPFTNNFVGNMKISPDGTKIASAIYGLNRFEICDFNASTGQVSNAVTSGPDFKWPYGIAFSPDMTKLYGSTAYVGGNPDSASRLYQFDITAGAAIFDAPFLIAENTDAKYFCALQQATDGKIYIARAFSYSGFGDLSVIYNPNREGDDCNLDLLDGNTLQFNLAGKNSSWGLPNFVQSYFDLPHFNADSICFFDSTMFFLRNEANVDNVLWDFGDPESGVLNTSTDIRPYHRFTEPGDYTVTVTETYNGKDYAYSESVSIRELPFTEIGDTVFMYAGSPVLLDAGEGFRSYYWVTGEETQSITVNEPGDYWVVIESGDCCFSIDSVKVILFDILVPNAFRPGGANPVFRAVPTGDVTIEKFEMLIFNRWGQLIFKGYSLEEGWDGNVEGAEAPGDVYVWVINYYVEREGREELVTFKGNVILLR